MTDYESAYAVSNLQHHQPLTKQTTTTPTKSPINWKSVSRTLQHEFLQLCNKHISYKHTMEVLGVVSVSIDDKQQELIVKINNTLKRVHMPQHHQQQLLQQPRQRSQQHQQQLQHKQNLALKNHQHIRKNKIGLNKRNVGEVLNAVEGNSSSIKSTTSTLTTSKLDGSGEVLDDNNVSPVVMNDDGYIASGTVKVLSNNSAISINDILLTDHKNDASTSANQPTADVTEQEMASQKPAKNDVRARMSRRIHGRKQSTPLKLSHTRNLLDEADAAEGEEEEDGDVIDDVSNKNSNQAVAKNVDLNCIDKDENGDDDVNVNASVYSRECSDETDAIGDDALYEEAANLFNDDNDKNNNNYNSNRNNNHNNIDNNDIGTVNATNLEVSSDATTYMCDDGDDDDNDDDDDGEEEEEMFVLPSNELDCTSNNDKANDDDNHVIQEDGDDNKSFASGGNDNDDDNAGGDDNDIDGDNDGSGNNNNNNNNNNKNNNRSNNNDSNNDDDDDEEGNLILYEDEDADVVDDDGDDVTEDDNDDIYPPKRKRQKRISGNNCNTNSINSTKTNKGIKVKGKEHLKVCSTLRAMLTERVTQVPPLIPSSTVSIGNGRKSGKSDVKKRKHLGASNKKGYVVIAPEKNNVDGDDECNEEDNGDDDDDDDDDAGGKDGDDRNVIEAKDGDVDDDDVGSGGGGDDECVMRSAVLSDVIHIKEEVGNDDDNTMPTSAPQLRGSCVLDSSQYNMDSNKLLTNYSMNIRQQHTNTTSFSTTRQILPAPSTNILTNPILAILPNASGLHQPHQQHQMNQQLQQQTNMTRLLQPTTLFTISDEAGNSLNNCFSLQLTQLAKNVLNVSGNTSQFPLMGSSSLQPQPFSTSATPILPSAANARLIASKPPQKTESDFVVDAFADVSSLNAASTPIVNSNNNHLSNNSNGPGKKFCRRRLNEDILSPAELAEYVGTCDETMSAPSIQRPYLCCACQVTCASLIEYLRHTLNEHNTFICHQCGKHFTTKSSLLRHRPIHTGLRRFACAICCKAFYRRDKCKAHIKKHLNSDPSNILSINSSNNNNSAGVSGDNAEVKTGYIVLSSNVVDRK